MRILLDECIDQRLRQRFPDHDCQTAQFAGLAGLKNGVLLDEAQRAGFQVLITLDQGIEYQQNLSGRKISVFVLHSKSNRLRHILELVPSCLRALSSIQPGSVIPIKL